MRVELRYPTVVCMWWHFIFVNQVKCNARDMIGSPQKSWAGTPLVSGIGGKEQLSQTVAKLTTHQAHLSFAQICPDSYGFSGNWWETYIVAVITVLNR